MADYARCAWINSLFLIGILVVHFIAVNSKDVVLLDTTKTMAGTYLNWTTKIVPATPPDASNKGWNEVSSYIQLISEDPLKVYTSCYVSSHQVNNWLRTPYISVGRAESLYLNVTFTMRKCVRHSDPSTLQQCRETFNLYSYEAAKDIANNEMPSWDDTSYTLVDKIPAKILSEETTDILLNSETRFVTLKRLQVTPTGPLTSSLIEQVGTCVANSLEVQKPIYRCMSDGTWDIPVGTCHCDPGYAAVDGVKCVACPVGYFKWQAGDFACKPCPNNSYTQEEHSKECACNDHFFRADTDDKNMPCTQPPTEPRDLRVKEKNDTAITLTWNPPADLGGRLDVTYELECLACGSDVTYELECLACGRDVMVSPKSSGFNSTSVELTRLKSSTTYMVTIYSKNGVTSLTTAPRRSAQINFTTNSSLAEIRDVRVVMAGYTYISLTWEVLGDPLTQTIVQYEVNYSVRGQQSSNSSFTETNSITIKELVMDTEYIIKVRGKTLQKGWGEYSQPFYTATRLLNDAKKELDQSPSVGIIVGAIVAVILCMAIAAIMILLLLRRNRRNDGKSSDIDGPFHHVLHCPPLEPHINGSMTVPLFQPTGTIKSYVDPHTYEDPSQAVREFTREIDALHITIESVIGGGEFGDVCKGKLRIPGKPEMTVAIKTLKPGATDKNRLDFLTEASIMGQFDDPNVIFLEGVVTKANPIIIVTEYMANGSLDSFLRKNDGQLTVIQLVGMMRGIASGMRYLSDMGYVHRDLAARNILCNESLVCKVADFGLSREVDIDTTDGAYTTKGGKIPVRWTAPEAIAFRKFTSASDVWSFGVVMWEIISYGERPYWNWPNQDVIKAVEKGYRLPPPMECPEELHNLMLETWHRDRNNRPKFLIIVKSIDKLIRIPELLRKMAKPRPHVFIDYSPPDISNFPSVDNWLNAIKMERYRDSFVLHKITCMDQVMCLTSKDLETLGVTLLGHQKRILNSVQNLRAHLIAPQVHLPHMQVSEGFLV